MTEHTQLEFSDDVADVEGVIADIEGGRGWCNLSPIVLDDAEPISVNTFGLTIHSGVAVASLVTYPPKGRRVQPSTLGLLHTRGRLERTQLLELLGEDGFVLQQNHNRRGLLVAVPPSLIPSQILAVMMRLTSSLCDYELTGRWRLDLFRRTPR